MIVSSTHYWKQLYFLLPDIEVFFFFFLFFNGKFTQSRALKTTWRKGFRKTGLLRFLFKKIKKYKRRKIQKKFARLYFYEIGAYNNFVKQILAMSKISIWYQYYQRYQYVSRVKTYRQYISSIKSINTFKYHWAFVGNWIINNFHLKSFLIYSIRFAPLKKHRSS